MKITKSQLRKIIKEELLKEFGSEGLDDILQRLNLTIERHEPDDDSPEGLSYELELFDLSGGDTVKYFQQYEGMPEGTAEKELRSYLERRRR